ncbi:MAG TPA: PAS domain S-box protein [Candidatus Saccharicenans sp.]|nr:PAS domain S-box protein [Candidatus Saccharicenans sp.]HRD02712.1 PAS domain S-box protein [Candidatus Saccharicenans sp.]
MKSIERQKKKVKTTGIDLPSKEISFQKWWDRVPFACYLLSTAGIITDVNQAGARILGYEQEEMVGRPIFSFILPEERVEAKKRFKQKLAGQPVPRVKDRIYLKKDGSKIYMARNDRIERDRQGEPVSICSTMVDITDYKKIEADLKATEERYKDLVEKAGIAILIDDRKGNVVYANKRYAEIFGYSIKEIKSFSIFSVVHPDDLKRVKSYHQGRFLGKKTPGRFDFKGIKKDGSIIYLEVVSTLIKRDKTAVGTQSYMWDITEQKKTEAALRESEGLYRSIVEHSHDGVLLIDENYKIIYSNNELNRNLDYSPDEILGHDFRGFLDEESRLLVSDHYIRRQRGEKVPSRYEFNVVRKDGVKRRVEISSDVIIDESGKTRTVAQLLDITDRKKAEELNLEMMKNLRRALDSTINVIALTVEARDPFTSGHQRRVADLARMIATEMRLPKDSIEAIRSAAIIHDLGKIHVPADILNKPSKLTEVEFNFIKAHPQVAYNILKDIEFPWPVAEIIYEHHERWNGSGYPRGLSGQDILLEARILAVADVVEAMASHRPYRPPLGIDKALEELVENRDQLYDPDVVDACLRVFTEKHYTFKP